MAVFQERPKWQLKKSDYSRHVAMASRDDKLFF